MLCSKPLTGEVGLEAALGRGGGEGKPATSVSTVWLVLCVLRAPVDFLPAVGAEDGGWIAPGPNGGRTLCLPSSSE